MIPRLLFYATFLLAFCLSSTALQAQTFPKDVWHEGEITLFNGENMTGWVKYNLDNDNVQVRLANGATKSYGSRTVESFEFTDAIVRLYRTFFTLPYERKVGYETPTFFELLTDGKLALLNREEVIMRMMPVYGYVGMGNMFTDVPVLTDNFYFLIKNEQKVVKFGEKREQILELMKDKSEKITDYLSKNAVDFGKRRDLMALVDFYNAN